ncbi:hypothetical protein [Kordiimonas laminariae]|uniref:hypothetical protein n=1 Tax=Kordiimonas laminariae TaxID=2917717 RepID=UPI001FF580F0|nr:hypothetical protein [Kordiimonas laminariae]MCK0068278.1 hypothetical protein [Kordiimonas laminariae]
MNRCFLVFLVFLSVAVKAEERIKDRRFQLEENLCVHNIDGVEIFRNGTDFLIVKLKIKDTVLLTYMGNHPQTSVNFSALSEQLPPLVQEAPFILIQGTNVYRQMNEFFPAYLHFMGVEDLSILEDLKHIQVTEKCGEVKSD